MNLYTLFQERWDRSRLFLRDLSQGKDYAYADLDRETARIASRLVSRYDVRPGDRVAVQVEKSPEAYFLYLACLRVGAVYLPMNPAYQAAEVEYFLDDAEPRAFIRGAVGLGELLEALDSEPQEFATVAREASDLAAILYTSGTTGRSKGAMLTHGNLAANAQALAEAWGFSVSDRLLHALPIYHVHGLFISLHCTLLSGSSALWLSKFDAAEVVRYLPEATVFMGVPTYYTRLLELSTLDRKHCAGIRLFVSGSAPLRPETFDVFEQRTGSRILERYGMTETGVICSNPLRGVRVAGSVGQALPGVEVRIAGETGMIEVRGANVFPGYWKLPGKSREEFTADGFFRTGDLGSRDENGYVQIVGRAKDLVITGGFNVYPKEIELVLDALPGVDESAVFGVPHPDFGEAVVAAIVVAPGAAPAESELIAQLKRRLAGYKVPKRVFIVDQLPKNVMGKVQKNLLRERFARGN